MTTWTNVGTNKVFSRSVYARFPVFSIAALTEIWTPKAIP